MTPTFKVAYCAQAFGINERAGELETLDLGYYNDIVVATDAARQEAERRRAMANRYQGSVHSVLLVSVDGGSWNPVLLGAPVEVK